MQRCSFLQWLIVPTILLVLAGSFCACSSTSPVCESTERGGYSYTELNNVIDGRDVIIKLKDGSEVSASNINITPDSISWGSKGAVSRPAMSTVLVDRITMKNHFVGALEGLGMGAAIGGGTGYALGSTAEKGGEIPVDAIGFILGGALGTIVGVTTGVIVGHRYHYEPCVSVQPASIQKVKAGQK